MLTRMLMHSAVFTLVIAIGAVAVNGTGLLNGAKPGRTWYASGYGSDDHKWKHSKHDD